MKYKAEVFVHGFVEVEFESNSRNNSVLRLEAVKEAVDMFTFKNDLEFRAVNLESQEEPRP